MKTNPEIVDDGDEARSPPRLWYYVKIWLARMIFIEAGLFAVLALYGNPELSFSERLYPWRWFHLVFAAFCLMLGASSWASKRRK